MKGFLKMKLLPKYYNKINTEPFEVQETPDATFEIYNFNDYPTLHKQHTNSNAFTMWSSDGNGTYKLLIDNDYYDVMKELYTKNVNLIWLDFFETNKTQTNKFLLKTLGPLAFVIAALITIIIFLLPFDMNIRLILCLVVAIISIFPKKIIENAAKEKSAILKNETIDKINAEVGETVFSRLLEDQEHFITEFNKKRYLELYGEEAYEEYLASLNTTDTQLEENTLEENNEDNINE